MSYFDDFLEGKICNPFTNNRLCDFDNECLDPGGEQYEPERKKIDCIQCGGQDPDCPLCKGKTVQTPYGTRGKSDKSVRPISSKHHSKRKG